MNSTHLWLAAALVCLSIEALQGGPLVFIFLALACGASSVGSWLNFFPEFWQQACVFSLTSAAGLTALRPVVARISRKNYAASAGEIGSPVGSIGTALSAAQPNRPLRVEVFGAPWSATLLGHEPIIVGQRCRVVAVHALTLSVESLPQS